MTDQSNQTSQGALNAQELRQFLLDQLSAEQKVIEELSDEELETIAGAAPNSDGIGGAVDAIRRGAQHTPSTAGGFGNKMKEWIKKPSNQVAVGGPVVTASAAFTVGFVNKAMP
jgi:hypothetical protein